MARFVANNNITGKNMLRRKIEEICGISIDRMRNRNTYSWCIKESLIMSADQHSCAPVRLVA
jgi:hypothetical protein